MWGGRTEEWTEWTEWREQQWDRRASRSLGRHQEEAVEGGVAPACYEQGTRSPERLMERVRLQRERMAGPVNMAPDRPMVNMAPDNLLEELAEVVEAHAEWRQRKAEEMASAVPMEIEGTVVVDGVEGQPAATAMVHQIWEAPMVRAQDATLGGELQPEVQLLKPVEERWKRLEEEEEMAEGEARRGAEAEEGQPTLKPRGPAPGRARRLSEGQRRGNSKQRKKEGQKKGGSKRCRAPVRSKWYLPGFSLHPGSAVLVEGNYSVEVVQTQVVHSGEAGKEVWLGVKLRRSGGEVMGLMQCGVLQRKAAGSADWQSRLRGKTKEGWNTEQVRWEGGKEAAEAAGQSIRGAVVGWYLPVQIVEEKGLSSAGVKVVVQMKRVAVGRTPGGFEQAVGIRTRREWCRHSMSREKLLGISGQMVQAEGVTEALVGGQEVWEEWTGQRVEGTGWRRKAKGQLRAMEKAVERMMGTRCRDRDMVFEKG